MEDFTKKEISLFKSKWGQSHYELCDNIDLPYKTSDDIIMLDYFWLADCKKWFPKNNSFYSDREQEIENYLRTK